MEKEAKEQLIEIMESYKKGRVGLFAAEIERLVASIPAPRLAALMAIEIMIEAEARAVERGEHPNPELVTIEKSHEVSDMVREHIRGLSLEDFDAFTSEDSINEVMQEAKGRLQEMMGHACEECGACDAEGDDDSEDPETLLN